MITPSPTLTAPLAPTGTRHTASAPLTRIEALCIGALAIPGVLSAKPSPSRPGEFMTLTLARPCGCTFLDRWCGVAGDDGLGWVRQHAELWCGMNCNLHRTDVDRALTARTWNRISALETDAWKCEGGVHLVAVMVPVSECRGQKAKLCSACRGGAK